MQMPKFLLKFRRDRWRDKVLHEGQMLRECQQMLHALVAHGGWDEERERLYREIERRERRLVALRTKLKETASDVRV